MHLPLIELDKKNNNHYALVSIVNELILEIKFHSSTPTHLFKTMRNLRQPAGPGSFRGEIAIVSLWEMGMWPYLVPMLLLVGSQPSPSVETTKWWQWMAGLAGGPPVPTHRKGCTSCLGQVISTWGRRAGALHQSTGDKQKRELGGGLPSPKPGKGSNKSE